MTTKKKTTNLPVVPVTFINKPTPRHNDSPISHPKKHTQGKTAPTEWNLHSNRQVSEWLAHCTTCKVCVCVCVCVVIMFLLSSLSLCVCVLPITTTVETSRDCHCQSSSNTRLCLQSLVQLISCLAVLPYARHELVGISTRHWVPCKSCVFPISHLGDLVERISGV